jgi:hypothetical protein
LSQQFGFPRSHFGVTGKDDDSNSEANAANVWCAATICERHRTVAQNVGRFRPNNSDLSIRHPTDRIFQLTLSWAGMPCRCIEQLVPPSASRGCPLALAQIRLALALQQQLQWIGPMPRKGLDVDQKQRKIRAADRANRPEW